VNRVTGDNADVRQETETLMFVCTIVIKKVPVTAYIFFIF
jgi:hypothetical protein